MTRISYAQNYEDVRVWRAFQDVPLPTPAGHFTYVEVGANFARELSITASLSDAGWRGVLIEADPTLAEELRIQRPLDHIVNVAVSDTEGDVTFYRVPSTGLGTMEKAHADAARARGFEVIETVLPTKRLDSVLAQTDLSEIHFMSIDVEGAEAAVLSGITFTDFRPWVVCIEAVLPGTTEVSHEAWEALITSRNYLFVTFDGINRWYVAAEHEYLREAIAIPMNALDEGVHGWISAERNTLEQQSRRSWNRFAWQRELILSQARNSIDQNEVALRLSELEQALAQVEASRSWMLSKKLSGASQKIRNRGHLFVGKLPQFIRSELIYRRHLSHVTVNQGHLTDPAYLGQPTPDQLNWLNPESLPSLPEAGLQLDAFSARDAQVAREWLATGPFDSDVLLDVRMDNHDDELGRVMKGLRARLRVHEAPVNPLWAGGNKVLFDARSLQSASFGNRGIGRFASALLDGVRQAVDDQDLVLLVDRGLESLPDQLAGHCQQVTRVSTEEVSQYSVLVQPSPMTSSVEPLVPLLHSTAHKVAVVFDFIPMHYPTIYLRHAAARVEYAAQLDALRLFDEYICISQVARRELAHFLGRPWTGPQAMASLVAWPRAVYPKGETPVFSGGQGPIVVMTGDEPRKNTFGALAAVGAATSNQSTREVVVVGMAGQETRVHHWSIAGLMRPGEAETKGHLTDDEMHALLAEASLVVVASFDEGLSLPVIEAIRCGAPVVASRIPAHRELLGNGRFLADPGSPRKLARAIRRSLKKRSIHKRQAQRLGRHRHAVLEVAIARIVELHRKTAIVPRAVAPARHGGTTLSIGFATPWIPQRTGVADFSSAVGVELAQLCDLTVYTTADAEVPETIQHGYIDELIADPALVAARHDALITVAGNSHYQLTSIELLESVDAITIAHDTRMVEYYMALRDKGGAQQIMTRGQESRILDPNLDEQIDDMRLLQNAGFWEIARRSEALVLHSESAAQRIEQETGIEPFVLPFANQRVPHAGRVTDHMRGEARSRLNFDNDLIHLATYGYVDVRTKLTDVVVESAAWLSQWGHRVSLHLVGSASNQQAAELTARAEQAGIEEFSITGFVDEETFRDYLLAVDLGIQLRISPLLGVSGPLSDLAAFGTPALASNGLCVDVGTPPFVGRLPDEVSPLTVAEAVEWALANPISAELREQQRLDYLSTKTPLLYAQALLEVVRQVKLRETRPS